MRDFFRIIRYIKNLFLGLLCFFVQFTGLAQDSVEKHKTYVGLEYKQVEEQKNLIASLTARVKGKRGRQKVDDTAIAFYFLSDTSKILLGSAITDVDGKAQFELEDSYLSLISNSDSRIIEWLPHMWIRMGIMCQQKKR